MSLNAFTSASIAALAAGAERFDWIVAVPAVWVTGPVDAEVAQDAVPLTSNPAPAAAVTRRK
ncbi:hypothetical protein [Lentzea flaviverrucosa]|uniref:Uncharacterized protein n=1 Tax=Lentzea flaviverrucosa TaxID=200379 RepID=A0A1H9G2U8_9PSEU|nr:hypothetical protein [Lentzea flaviverrucosa]RDI35026.1 hypothetical protein DFR72_101776 [Lentzea flaviverrucosa]SEQ44505.1 hypothetical protein SAMN05216195_102441 [Lentzea flaviverrucosa]